MSALPRAIAIHEAGHAVVAHRLGEPVGGIFINELYGQTGFQPLPANAQRMDVERIATLTLAGSVASAIYQGAEYRFTPSGEMLSDEARAADLVERRFGITTLETNKVLQELADRARELLNDGENWALVERLADALLAKGGVLTAPEVAAVVPVSDRDGGRV
jgi:hypothetical protein